MSKVSCRIVDTSKIKIDIRRKDPKLIIATTMPRKFEKRKVSTNIQVKAKESFD